MTHDIGPTTALLKAIDSIEKTSYSIQFL